MRRISSPVAVCLIALLFLAPLPGRAEPATGPAAALRTLISSFYRPYLHAPPDQEPPDNAGVIAAHATPALARRIQNDKKCQIHSQGVCNLDFDIIISAQDWDLKAAPLVTVRQASARQIIIASQFTDGGTKTDVEYFFIQTDGEWLINEMTGTDSENNDWRLTKILANEPG